MKQFLLLAFIGSTSFLFGQAPDGFPSTFSSNGSGNWNSTGTWTQDVPGTDPDNIPDGDDYVIIAGNDVTVTANAGFGHLEYSASGPAQPTLTINTGISLTGYDTDEDGAITLTSNGALLGTKTLILNIDGGTASCTSLTISTTKANGIALLNIKNGGTLTVENDLTVSSFEDDTDVQLDATVGTGNTLNLGGAIIGIDLDKGIIDMGSSAGVSTFNFNGSAAQTIPFDDPTDLIYSDIQVSNPGGVTLESASASANFTGDLTISAGGLFIDGGFSNVFIEDIINTGIYDGSGTIDLRGDFTNSGTFASSGCNINIEGNWDNTGGTYTYFFGDNFTFDGAGISTISGATDWYELTAAKAIGVTVSSGAQSIHGILDLEQGTFASGGLVTLISDGTSTGQMDNIGTATFSGGLTVQRRIVKSSQTFSSIASPVTGTTLATWQVNGVLFSGFPTSDFPSFPFVNCYQYLEPTHGSDKDDGWDAATGMTNPTGPDNFYKAHYVYMDATTFNLSVSGDPVSGSVSIPLDFTSSGNVTQDGWNLIGNPYPCTIDFDAIYVSNAGDIVDGYLAYSGEYANYGWYNGATTAGGVGSNGATKDIPHSQGVWLKSVNGTSLSVTEAHKNATLDPTFLKSSGPEFMRIYLTGNVNTFQDEALIFSHQNYSDFYDGDDLVKFTTMDPDNAPTLFTQSLDGVDLAFNKLGINSVSIPVKAKAGTIAQGDYTLSFEIPTEFMLGACMTLEDLHTGNTVDLRVDTSYTYATSDTTIQSRFIIHIVKDFNTQVVDLTCFGTTDGLVTIDGSGITGDTFELLDGAGSAVFSGSAANDSIEFTNVPAGDYEVATNHIGSCSIGNFSISVIEPAQVIASFDLVEDTVYLVQGGLLEVNNMSSATNYTWDFGDGNTSIDENPTHIYTAPGIYQVMLTSDNDNVGQCTEVTSRNVVVMNGPLAIDDMQLEENTNAFVNNGKVVVDFDLENNSNVEITLVDVTGKIIISNEYTISNGRITLINTDEVSNGVYFVNITIEGQRKTQKLFID
jgi:hypothetical protein